MECEVCRARGLRRQAAEGIGGRERQAQEAAGGGDARQRDAQGRRLKKMVTPAGKREAVAHLRTSFEVSERRACAALGVDRTSVRYRSSRPAEAAVRARLRELAAIHRRFGYRRLHVLMRREGVVMNHKKLHRLYREERLQVRRRLGRKRALGTRAPMAIPQGPTSAG